MGGKGGLMQHPVDFRHATSSGLIGEGPRGPLGHGAQSVSEGLGLAGVGVGAGGVGLPLVGRGRHGHAATSLVDGGGGGGGLGFLQKLDKFANK